MSLMSKSNDKNVPAKRHHQDFDLFKKFEDFFELNRRGEDEFWDDFNAVSFSPAVNIEESDKSYFLEAELPGVKKEDLEINIKDDYLVIKGEKKSFNEEKKKGQLIKVERSFGSFYRTIALPSDIDKEQVNAELKDGLLHIEIKKSANQVSEQKKIPVH